MMDADIKNVPLSFINTPLQNLRNILLEVDTSIKNSPDKIARMSLEWTITSGEKTVLKSELQRIIFELKTISGQYVTRADIGKIFLSICENNEQNVNLASINKLKEIIKT